MEERGSDWGNTWIFIYIIFLLFCFGSSSWCFLAKKKGLNLGIFWGLLSVPVVILSRFSYFAETSNNPPLILKILFLPGFISEYLGRLHGLNAIFYLGILPPMIGALIGSIIGLAFEKRQVVKI